MHAAVQHEPERRARRARRLLALALGAAGLLLALCDLRPLPGESGPRLAWSFAGVRADGLCAPLAPAEFVERFERWAWLLAALALVLGTTAGAALARALAARLGRRAGAGTLAASALAGALACDPWVARFVATRDAFSAPRYLDAGDLLRGLGMGAITAALALWVASPRAAAPAWTPPRARAPRLALGLAMLAAALLPSLVLPLPADGPPLTNDEQAYLFQARLFAQQDLVHEAGTLADFFPAPQTQSASGRIFSKYPPGHSLVLAPGSALGWPLLVPRLLAALSVWLVWLLARRFGSARPELAAWLFALSPFFLGVEALALSHGSSLPLTLLFLVAALEALSCWSASRARALGLAVLAGAALALAFAARPVTALAFALVFVLLLALERPRAALALVPVALLAAVPAALFFLAVDRATTGDPWQTAYGLYNKAENSLWGAVDTPTALSIAAFNLGRISVWVHGLAPGLVLPVLGWSFGARAPRRWLLAALPLALFALYALHPFQGIPWCGPVYLVEALPLLVVLGVLGLEALERAAGAASLRVLVAGMLAGGALLLTAHMRLAREELELRAAPQRAAQAAGIRRGIVFVPLEDPRARRLFPLAPPRQGDELIFARELGARDAELRSLHPELPCWSFDPASGTLARR